jgi:hypothetical protein
MYALARIHILTLLTHSVTQKIKTTRKVCMLYIILYIVHDARDVQ